ncbi:MAG TPA: DUF4396 domain-containing protein [Methylovirgula sp.]|nr:DUF4396 domain-containing protein [Methylovirgula sp.]
MAQFPYWFHALALASLAIALACAALIILDEIARPQKMWIMNLVWPLCALFGSLIWLAFYFAYGREAKSPSAGKGHGHHAPTQAFPVLVAKGASHCGAGCTLGDIIAEWLAFLMPVLAIAFGWKSIFAEKMFAVWVLDYLLAFGLGIAFQYFTIKPMRQLSVGQGIREALKADFASITAWQIGMYGFMAFAQFIWFGRSFGGKAEVDTPEFWLIMQIAMICGFLTSYPVNWALLEAGVKEPM